MSFQTVPLGTEGKSAATVQQSYKNIGSATMASWQAEEEQVFEADCIVKFSMQKSVLHTRNSSEQDDEIITSNWDISVLLFLFLLVLEGRNFT